MNIKYKIKVHMDYTFKSSTHFVSKTVPVILIYKSLNKKENELLIFFFAIISNYSYI